MSDIAGDALIADAALPWLRIAIFAAPAILISLAGNGWIRGVQDTVRPLRYVAAGFAVSAVLCPLLVFGWLGLPRWGLAGSAVANPVGQWLSALLFCRALLAEGASLRPDPQVLRLQVVMGRDLVLRTMAFQVCPLLVAAVAARFGAAALAAHQALGGGDTVHARRVAWRVTAFSATAAMFLAQLPSAGIVFALDGVLMGAGDAAFMRTAAVISALAGFLPLVWLSLVFGWGLAGIWAGLTRLHRVTPCLRGVARGFGPVGDTGGRLSAVRATM